MAAPSFNIVIADPLHEAGWHILKKAKDVRWSGPYERREEVLQAVADADGLLFHSSTQVDRELLEAGRRLKAVSRAGARLDNVDIESATRSGIMVIHVPEANVIAIVEHTFALLLGLARHIARVPAALKEGRWSGQGLTGFELAGRQLGIIGFGRIGQEVALRAQAFGMRVLAYDPYIDLAFARDRKVEAVDFTELLARADVLSLHTTLTPETKGLINAQAFAQIKPGAVLVNCHQAALVDEAALLAALDEGRLAWAALDGLQGEPPSPDHPLLHHPRVLLTPRIGQNTHEAESLTATQAVEDLLDALRGVDYRNVVNLPFTQETTYPEIEPYMHLASRLGKLQGQLAEGWIVRVEVEIYGPALQNLVRPVASALLAGMLRKQGDVPVNWVSAPVLAYEQGISMAQAKGLVQADVISDVLACRIYWEVPGHASSTRHRTVAGVLFGEGEARLLQYDHFQVDAKPEGYVLVLENADVPGVIGKVGTRLGKAGINIAHWRYGREGTGKRAVSFINLDSRPPIGFAAELEKEPEILRARLVRL